MGDRSQPGFLIPSQRRVRHLCSVAARCLPADVTRAELPDVFFTLSTPSGVPLYQSETVFHSVNPTWLPIQWAQHTGGSQRLDVLEEPIVRLQLYAYRSPAPSSPSSEPVAASWPVCMPASFSLPEGATLLSDQAVDLRDLRFLGFDIFYVLAAVHRTGSSSGGGGGGGRRERDAGVDAGSLSADAAGYLLDAIPLNTLVITLADGQYVTPDTHAMIKPGDAAAAASGSSASASGPRSMQGLSGPSSAGAGGQPSGAPLAKHDLRRGFDAVNRLMQLRRDTLQAEDSTAIALREAGTALDAEPGGGEADSALLQRAQRLRQLRQLKEELEAQAQRSEDQLAASQSALQKEVNQFHRAGNKLKEVAALLPAVHSEMDQARDTVALLRHLLTAKQLSLLAELRTLYPIQEQEKGRRYAIRGIVLPAEKEFWSNPEEQVSTALGYTCHLVSLLSKYLQVPLRYLPQHMASRSSIRDEVISNTREFPLYWKGVDKDGVRIASRMLSRDVKQLLASQGIAVLEGAHVLANIQRLFSQLLDVPLPDYI